MMVINPEVEAKAKNKTVEQIKSEQTGDDNDGDDDEGELKEGEADGDENLPKRPDDRYPSFLELFAN
jgi:hypothetical protein